LLSLSVPKQRKDYQDLAELSEKLSGASPARPDSADDPELQVLLSEYETLREESMNSSSACPRCRR
jgi:hypothetical protein